MKKILHTLSQHKLFLIVVLSGIGLRLWNIGWSLPDVYEEATPFLKAWNMWNGDKEGLDLNPHFFNYPAFSIYLQFATQGLHYIVGYLTGAYQDLPAFRSAYEADPTTFILAARFMTMLFDSGTIILVYAFTLTLFRDLRFSQAFPILADPELSKMPKHQIETYAGLIASMLVGINPIMIRQGHLINVDTPLVFFTTLSLFYIYRLFKQPGISLSIQTGIAIGLATATKYTGLFLLPIALFGLVVAQHSLKNIFRTSLVVQAFILIAFIALIFFAFNPFILLDWNEFQKDFSFEQEHIATGHLGVDADTNGFFYYVFTVIPQNCGWLLLAGMIGSIVFLLIQRKKELLVLLTFPLLYLIIISTWNMRVERYILPAIPALLMITAIGSTFAIEMLRRYFLKKNIVTTSQHASLFIALAVVATILLGFVPLQNTLSYQRSLALPDTRSLASSWLKENLPDRSIIATGPFGIKIPKEKFTAFQIPFTPTGSENLFMFYQTKWFEDFDVLVASDYDYARFAQDPVRYKNILQYYDSLRANWYLIHEIKPDVSQQSPTFWFYLYNKPIVDTFSTQLFQNLSIVMNSQYLITFTEDLARTLYLKGRLRKSEQLMRYSIMLDPNNLRLYRELSWLLFKIGNFTDALEYTNQSLNINPEQPEMVAIQGSLLLRMGDFKHAEERLLQSLLMNSRLELSYLDLDLLYSRTGDVTKQIENLHRYLSILPPDGESATMTRNRIQQLQQAP